MCDFVQEFVSQSAIEALHKYVLYWLVWRDVMPANASVLTPAEYGVRGHFRAIVTDNHIRLTTRADQFIKFTRHPRAGQRTIHDSCQCLASAVIHDAKHAETLAICNGIRHKVERSTLIGLIWYQNGPARAQSPLARLSAAHGQPFLAIQPEQLLVFHFKPFSGMQKSQTTISKRATLVRKFAQPLA